MKRDFLTVAEFTGSEIEGLLTRAIDLKAGKDRGACPLAGKSIGLFFEKPSTRTRVSFEVGIYQLGAQPLYLTAKEIQLNRGETIADTARVLSRYMHGLVLRTYAHSTIEEFAVHAAIPVINALSDKHHPCQSLADLMTVLEKKGRLKGIRLAYIGDGNNVANSLIEAAARVGMEVIIACPEGYEPDPEVLERSRNEAKGEIVLLRDPREAAAGADVVYTDVWVSMGQEGEAEKKRIKFQGYQVNGQLLQCARRDALVLHCLPAHRGEEITNEIMDGPNSVVFDQAENRLHTAKALLEMLIR
ncbi:MAG: ornithine carbamoyltransferase [Alphaproteobacteria bacterium]|uniref:Ornithine carbamoyltransferase n=1 Tax=Candidatus Nitrobium versatile TaxID=2884831 RepID=A0A953M1X9_9BACT|nr:ornithine carbamoyltransferase [Candidatus Nitrobium versatile]